MVNLGAAKLTGVIMTIGIVAMAGNNLAYAQQPSSCGEQAYGYIGCTPLNTAQLIGGVLVASIVAFAMAWGVAERQYHTIP
ncbi:MAG: hypothetical protein ACREBB_04105 [Nitrosotalea sp.]